MYGCHNKPRPTADSNYIAQFGWHDTLDAFGQLIARYPIYVEVKSAFGTIDCQYDKSSADARCAGCNHIKGDTK